MHVLLTDILDLWWTYLDLTPLLIGKHFYTKKLLWNIYSVSGFYQLVQIELWVKQEKILKLMKFIKGYITDMFYTNNYTLQSKMQSKLLK